MSTDLIITRHSDEGNYTTDFDVWLWGAAPAKPAPSYLRPAACPLCGKPVQFNFVAGIVQCGACQKVWNLTAQEADDLDWSMLGLTTTDPTLLLAAIAARQTPPEPPPATSAARPRNAKRQTKQLIRPAGDETERETWERLANQAERNGVQVFINPTLGVYRATSQEKRPDGTPVRRYTITQISGQWACSCAAVGPCAHLALFYRRLKARAATTGTAAEIAARAAQAYDDLYGGELHKSIVPQLTQPQPSNSGQVAA